ncbi:MAG: DUF333 domain-containing protein [Candidatus Pacearchaeota archaeon]|nr:DUF333 domain-containing protein [Candidatus Pacearchaeota archaeon]
MTKEKKKKLFVLFFFILVAILLISVLFIFRDREKKDKATLPNPASKYCIENNGTLEIRKKEHGYYGVCIFPDGSECEEWAFYRNECHPQYFKINNTH